MEINTQLFLTEEYQESEVQFIINQIDLYNQSIAPTAQETYSEPLNLILKDQEGQIFGKRNQSDNPALAKSVGPGSLWSP
jgi:hypothetical protein